MLESAPVKYDEITSSAMQSAMAKSKRTPEEQQKYNKKRAELMGKKGENLAELKKKINSFVIYPFYEYNKTEDLVSENLDKLPDDVKDNSQYYSIGFDSKETKKKCAEGDRLGS